MRRRTIWAALPLLWLATALRFYRLGAQSFWNDEGNSARLAERSIKLIVEGAAGDVHPPLYYLLLSGWRQLLGDGEFALRTLSAFAGVLLVAGVFALGWLFVQKRYGARKGWVFLAALFAAMHPALVYYSQEARMYALLGLWAVLSTLLLLRLLPLLGRRPARPFYIWSAGYLLVTISGLYTHYFYPVILLVHNVVAALVLLGRRRTAGRRPQAANIRPEATHNTATPPHLYIVHWSALMLATFLLYLPWLPIFLRQTGGRGADPIPASTFLTNAARWLVLGETVPADASWFPVIAAFALAMLGLVGPFFIAEHAKGAESKEGREDRGGEDRDSEDQEHIESPAFPVSNLQSPISNPQSPISSLQSLLPTLQITLPPIFILLLGATRPAYYKFMIVGPPFLALLAARGVAVGRRWARRGGRPRRTAARVALVMSALLLLWGSVQSLGHLYFDAAFARADYRGIAARIAAEGYSDAGIILNAANQWEVFTYYHRDGAPVYPLPRGQPDPQRIEAELREIAAQHARLYALFWGEDERDPQRLVERWLDAHAFKAREEWVGDVRFVTYAVLPEPAGEMTVRSGVTFGQDITLLGYTIGLPPGATLSPGDILPLTLFWQTAHPLDIRYKVFLHLLGREGRLFAQRDAEPVGNLAPTTTWQPGETVVDNHGLLLPADLPPGQYTLRLGLYRIDDPTARLPVGGADSFSLRSITVR